MLNLGAPHLSREFHKFTKSLSEAKSKQEEERIIAREISLLKLNFQNKNVSKNQLKEYLIRCLHLEMLGFNTKFAHIHAVNMAQDKVLVYKSTGYLCCSTMLKSDNDLKLLLINTIQKDLQSNNFVDRLIVLNNLCYLINEEMLPIILDLVNNNMNHENEFVRKKTVLVLTRVYELYPDYLKDTILTIIQKGICDVNPSVMNVSLDLLLLYLSVSVGKNDFNNKIFINPLINIWKQILDDKLSKDYNYHKVSAPFIQIKIMKLLGILCSNKNNNNIDNNTNNNNNKEKDNRNKSNNTSNRNRSNSKDSKEYNMDSGLYNILYKFTQYIENNTNLIIYSLIYQFLQLLSNIQLNEAMLSMASLYISKLLNSTANNIKYISVKSINMLMDKNIVLSIDDQIKLINYLQEDDITIQKIIIKLLYKLINKNNYNLIIEQLLQYLTVKKQQLFNYEQDEIVFKVIEFCKLYCDNITNFVNIILQIIQISYKQFNKCILYSIIDLISQYQDGNYDGNINGNNFVYYILNQCFQMYTNDVNNNSNNNTNNNNLENNYNSRNNISNNNKNELLVKLMMWLIKYIIYMNKAGRNMEQMSSKNNNYKEGKELFEDNKENKEDNNEEKENNNLKYDVELYKSIINELLNNCFLYDHSLLYWILNNCRDILIYLEYDVEYNMLDGLQNKYTDSIKQILLEINNLNKYKPVLKYDNKNYDSKLTFLNSYVELHKQNGCREYSREEVMNKYKKVKKETEDEDNNDKENKEKEKEDKLIYKPYLLMNNSIENVVEENVPDRLIIDERTNRSWGPKGYLNRTNSSKYVIESKLDNKEMELNRMNRDRDKGENKEEEDKEEYRREEAEDNDRDNKNKENKEKENKKEEKDKFNIDNVILNKYNNNKWNNKMIERQKNEQLAKQLFQNLSISNNNNKNNEKDNNKDEKMMEGNKEDNEYN